MEKRKSNEAEVESLRQTISSLERKVSLVINLMFPVLNQQSFQ